MKKLLIPALLALTLTACGGGRTVNPDEGAVDVDNTSAQVTPYTPEQPAGGSIAELNDPNSPLYQRSVFFEFDSFTVPPQYFDLIEAHANFLNKDRSMRILIQGNTDTRGSREYNLSLGQKRAEAVKQALLLRGVQESQVEAVSLGKEKQRCDESSESCYAENRRGDILYQANGEF